MAQLLCLTVCVRQQANVCKRDRACMWERGCKLVVACGSEAVIKLKQ